jgi:hypothetical protein
MLISGVTVIGLRTMPLSFHRVNLPRLLFDIHVLVDNADTALLGQRNREPCFGHRVHRGGQNRDIERDFGRQPRTEIHFARQNLRIAGLQENIVERQGFLGDAHGRGRVSR